MNFDPFFASRTSTKYVVLPERIIVEYNGLFGAIEASFFVAWLGVFWDEATQREPLAPLF